MNIKNWYKKENGFTIIEALVAIGILTIAIGGPISIASRSIFSGTVAKEKLVATYLAIEGIELARNVRDNNLLDPAEPPWTTGLDQCYAPEKCEIDAVNGRLAGCGGVIGGMCNFVFFNAVTGIYSMSVRDPDWEPTIYTRELSIEWLNSDEIVLTVTVEWNAGTSLKTFTINESLFNWQE